MKKEYCTQNNGNCETCCLVNYGLDCNNKPCFYAAIPKGLPLNDPDNIHGVGLSAEEAIADAGKNIKYNIKTIDKRTYNLLK